MNLSDIKKCPHCNHEGDVEYFSSWEKGGKKGFLGKNPEGFIMLMCPKCQETIKYDTLGNKFIKKNEGAIGAFIFNLVFVAVFLFIFYWAINYFF